MDKYYDHYADRPYIYHDGYPYVYLFRVHTPTGKPSKCKHALKWLKSKKPLTEEYIRNNHSIMFKPDRKGQHVRGPFIY